MKFISNQRIKAQETTFVKKAFIGLADYVVAKKT